jgi:hypothetical protein
MIAWIKKLLATIGHVLQICFSFIGNFFTGYASVAQNASQIEDAINELKANLKVQADRLLHFKFEPHWKTRVINVPIAIKQIQDLFHLFTDDFQERFEKIRIPIASFEALIESIKSPAPGGGPGEAQDGFQKATLIIQGTVLFTQQLADAFNEINEFEDLFRQLIDQIEGLDALFLQQGNARKWETVHIRSRVRR